MKPISLLLLFIALSTQTLLAQKDNKDKETKEDKKKKVTETINKLPDMIIANPDNGPDTMANKLRNDNLYLTVNPMWKEKGTQIGNDLKVLKINEDPLAETFPVPDKKIASGLTITMLNQKKTIEEKKAALATQVKTHLQGIYKESGKSQSADQLAATVKSMVGEPQPFTTDEGKQGELYLSNDISTEQSNFLITLIVAGNKPGFTETIQFNYYHYNYETSYPDDLLELRVFAFPDDQAAYVDFTKKVLKTLKIY